jgi:hypothetical protein
VNSQVLSALKPMVGYIAKYFGIQRFIQISARALQRGTREYHSEEAFWRDLIGRDSRGGLAETPLQLNDIAVLRGFQLSEWFPRSPGTYWTPDGRARREWAAGHKETWDEETEVLTPMAKTRLVTGGVGTCRVKAHKGDNGRGYGVLCATSSGICDAGIPVVVGEDLYNSVLDLLHDGKGVEANVTGQLLVLPFDCEELLLGARGAEIPDDMRSFLTTPLDVPCYYLRVESRLHLKPLLSDFKLESSAWTLYSDADGAWSFTYAGFDPMERGAVDRATEFLVQYVRRHRGTRIYTDFDEHLKRLDARHPLDKVMSGNFNCADDMLAFVTWTKTLQGARESRDPYRYM